MSQYSKVVKKRENKDTRPSQETAQTQKKVDDGASNAAHTPDACSLGPEIKC